MKDKQKTYNITFVRYVRQTITLSTKATHEGEINPSRLYEYITHNENNLTWIDDTECECEEGEHQVSPVNNSTTNHHNVGLCKFCTNIVINPDEFHHNMPVCNQCWDPRLQTTS